MIDAYVPSSHILLDPVVPTIPGPPLCAGCGRHPATVEERGEDKRIFKDVTGLRWPKLEGCIGLNLKSDRGTLALSMEGLPDSVRLCLPCSVTYMRRFNELNEARIRHEVERHVAERK